MTPKVVVTGATGFVATEVIKQLLVKGYDVIGTVRNCKSPKTEILKKLGKVLPGNLQLVEADLLMPGAFDEHVKGAMFIFHVASPFVFEVPDPEEDIVKVSLQGTQNVFSSIIKAKASIQRVVLTSSVAAVHAEYAEPPRNNSLYNEDDWNLSSSVANGMAYHYSKRAAEEWAWQEAKARGLDLVTICPNFVLGPVLSSHTDSLSIGFMKSILEGGKIEDTPIICDVRDVAYAHIAAAEVPQASGRYIVSNAKGITPKLVSSILQAEYPDLSIQDGAEAVVEDKMDDSKVRKQLCLSPYAPTTTLLDMARTILQLKIADTSISS